MKVLFQSTPSVTICPFYFHNGQSHPPSGNTTYSFSLSHYFCFLEIGEVVPEVGFVGEAEVVGGQFSENSFEKLDVGQVQVGRDYDWVCQEVAQRTDMCVGDDQLAVVLSYLDASVGAVLRLGDTKLLIYSVPAE